MTVHLSTNGNIELLDHFSDEDAELLQRHLLDVPGAVVECGGCTGLHAAVLQVLLVARPSVQGMPGDAFMQKHVMPILKNLQRNL